MPHIYDMIIIGGGPAGYTAALYGARSGFDTVILEKLYAGGQMALTPHIDNYPGFDESIDGFYLGDKMRRSAERFGAKTISAEVISAELSGNIKTVHTEDKTYLSRTVVIATGATPKELGIPAEKELVGRGISYCAACDGMFFKDKTVMVVGGGNTAAEDALLLSRICKNVIMVHRRDTLRASKVYHDPLMNMPNVEFKWNSTVSELLYSDKITGVTIKNLKTDDKSIVNCSGVFISIGRKPATELVKDQLELDQSGYIVADESTITNIPGVFAVGDVRTKAMRQVVTAVADGAVACHYAEEYLVKNNVL